MDEDITKPNIKRNDGLYSCSYDEVVVGEINVDLITTGRFIRYFDQVSSSLMRLIWSWVVRP